MKTLSSKIDRKIISSMHIRYISIQESNGRSTKYLWMIVKGSSFLSFYFRQRTSHNFLFNATLCVGQCRIQFLFIQIINMGLILER